MKDTLLNIEDLSDSKEALLMKPSRLILIFTCVIAAFLITAFIWMDIGMIDMYVTAVGLVRTGEAASVLRVINGGRAAAVHMTDGQNVSKGDELLRFDQQALNTRLENNGRDMENLQNDAALLRLYRNSIEDLTNYLSGNDTDKGRAYSLKVESFLLERQTALTQVAEDEKNNELQKSSAELQLSGANNTLSQLQSEKNWLQLYRSSLENGRDMISVNQAESLYKTNYLSLYQKYAVGLDALQTRKAQAQTNLDKVGRLYEMGTVARKDLDDAQNAVTEADNQIKSYRQTEISATDAKLAEMNIQINSAREAVKAAQQEADLYSVTKTSPLMRVDQAKIDLLTQIDSDIQQKSDAIDALNADNASLSAQIGDSVLTAPIDGVLNLETDVNEGDTVAPNTKIGSITPPNSDSFKVTMQVGNKDIAGIQLNQQVKFRFLALPYQEYGMVDGYVSNISADSVLNQQTGASYYIVEAVIENKPITSYRGANESIKVGMAVEGRLISGRKTVLRWLSEKMNFA